MYDFSNILEQLMREKQESRLQEAHVRRLLKQAGLEKSGLHQKVLLGLGEQMISIGSQLKARYSKAPQESHSC